LRDVSDDDLIYMMSAPIAAAILAEARINQDITPPQQPDENRPAHPPFGSPFSPSRFFDAGRNKVTDDFDEDEDYDED
ncbi:hypothetical protein, partial [Klebsiella variicola]|uniref:hypothetical protein n=1 Tax=Klebsiella variicola TaxID=244366 RepID=UPI002730BA2C